jgi:hypothetical protein
VEAGEFEIIKHSLRSLTGDRRLQALLIGFAFGTFMEGAAGFGTPVASAMLLRFACLRTPRRWRSVPSRFQCDAGRSNRLAARPAERRSRTHPSADVAFYTGYIILVASFLTASQIVSPR